MWKRIIKSVRARGYTGADDDLDAIKAFIAEKGLNFETPDGAAVDLDKEVAAYKAKAATVIVEAETDTTTEDDEGEQPASAGAKSAGGDTDTKAELLKLKARMEKMEAAPSAARAFKANSTGYRPAVSMIRAENAAYNRKNFGLGRNQRAFADADQARAFGAWFRCELLPKSATADDWDLHQKTQTTYVQSAGGATIPEDFVPQLIDLKEQYGVARQVAGVTAMSNDTLTFPRRTGGLTVYAPGEAGTITASDVSFDNVTVTAKKLATLTALSSEVVNDSSLSMPDTVAREIAQAFANKEDDCYFNGDGTSTYFGFYGVCPKLKAVDGTIANIKGLQVASGNLFSEFTLFDFEAVIGILPQFADSPNTKWVAHRYVWATTMLRRLKDAGGATPADISVGAGPGFLGYGVSPSQVMPKTDVNSQIAVLLGDFSMGTKFGEVRGSMQIATSDQYGFANDLIYIRGTERVAISVHDIGDTTNAGPIVGLISAAS